MTTDPIYLGVLVSGRGTNLQSLIDATASGRLRARIAVVISNVEGAGALDRAQRAGIETLCLSHRGWPAREDYDQALVRELQARSVGLVCLAGFMRIFTPVMVRAFPNAILNIHPALLPCFPGMHAQRQALQHGVKVAGVTVHFVTDELDAGPIVLQRTVPVLDEDDEASLSARILVEEHQAYPDAVQTVLEGGWRIDGRRFIRDVARLRADGAAGASTPRPRAGS